MRKKLRSPLIGKIFWMIFLIFIYICGSKLTLPFVDVQRNLTLGLAAPTLEFSAALMGGNLRSMSFLSVGLSPWMSAMLLWQMFSLSKKLGLSNLAGEVQERRRMYLTFAISLLQSLAVSLSLPLQTGVNRPLLIALNTLILIAGTFFLVWLTDVNSALGLGGSMTILMTSMLAYLPQDLISSIQALKLGWQWLVALIILAFLYLYLAILMEHANYRIPINKLNIHNRFKKYSYLDIKPNPAGGMPIMYAMTLVSIPQYFLLVALFFLPQNQLIQSWIVALSMGKPAWLALYLLTIFFLGLGFAFVNISGQEIADKMMKSGKYIDHVYPGPDTSRYINKIVLHLAIFGSLYLLLLSGLPMLLILKDIRLLRLSMIPGIFMIFLGMVFMIQDEVKAMTLNEKYTSLL